MLWTTLNTLENENLKGHIGPIYVFLTFLFLLKHFPLLKDPFLSQCFTRNQDFLKAMGSDFWDMNS